MTGAREEHDALPRNYAGVPLGGVGTGCVELGEDGLFRNVTINNNRTAATRIPFALGSFVAVRAESGGESVERILQPRTSVAFDTAGIDAPYANADELSWYGLYPSSNFRLDKSVFPLDVNWSTLGPVIPYDTEACTLPAFISVLQISNPTAETQRVSAMFNWENIRGSEGDANAEDRGAIKLVSREALDEVFIDGVSPDPNLSTVPVGLSFALNEACRNNADGDYCLAAEPQDGTQITWMGWDKNEVASVQEFWSSFSDRGALPNTVSKSEQAHCGAVCSQATIDPGESKRFIFVFAWYCPVFRVEGENIGNGYTREYANAMEVAEYGLKHAQYFLRAVSNWQKRFTDSSLPSWYTRMLLNSSHVLTTNTLLTKDGGFAMMESPADPLMGVLDRSFYTSIGTLLFYPGFAEKELEQFAPEMSGDQRGRAYRDFGKLTLRQPSYGDGEDEMIDLNAKFVLMAYRNFHLSGKLATLMGLFPRLKEAMEHGLRLDRNGDGIPDAQGDATMFRGWASYGTTSYVGPLWISAMLAYAKLARQLNHTGEAARYENLARRSRDRLEQQLWNEKGGYYRLYHDEKPLTPDHEASNDGCHSAQLAGMWASDFLNLAPMFPHERIVRALDAIDRLDVHNGCVAKGYDPDGTPCTNPPAFAGTPQTDKAWPGFDSVYVACPHLYWGDPDRGMRLLRSTWKRLHGKHRREFNFPLSWDPAADAPSGWKQDRHMSAMSLWHTLFAIEGFYLSVPDQFMAIAPRLPEGIKTLSAPLFTPVTLGWMNYRVRTGPTYVQKLEITFDSPVSLKAFRLSIPKTVAAVKIVFEIDEELVSVRHEIKGHSPENRLYIFLDEALQLQHPITIRVESIPRPPSPE